MRIEATVTALLAGFFMMQGAKKQSGEARAPLPVDQLEFHEAAVLTGLPRSSAMGHPLHCSVAGDSFVDIYADENSTQVFPFPKLYRITQLGDVSLVKRALPSGYEKLWMGDFFAGSQWNVSLLKGQKANVDSVAGDRPESAIFLSLTRPDGSDGRTIKLDLGFEPMKVAIFDSGKFAVVGMDRVNVVPVLAILNEDGTLDRMVDLNNKSYEQSKNLGQAFGAKGGAALRLSRELDSASFVPMGSKVLLVQAGSALDLRVLNDAGEEGRIQLTLPSGFLLEDALASDSTRTIFLRLRAVEAFEQFAQKHIIENPKEQILEIDAGTGKAIEAFELHGPLPGEVTCAVDQRLTAIYYVPVTGSATPAAASKGKPLEADQIILGTAPIP